MIIGRVLQLVRRPALDREFDASFPLMGKPKAVVETELNLLLHIAGKVVRRDPTGVDIKRGFATALVFVDEAELGGIPGWAVLGSDQAALAGAGDAL
jgi:hypothetical protein